MLHLVVAAGLEDVQEAHKVTLQIGIRVGDAIAHTSLSGQVDHFVELLFGKQPVNALLVVDGHADEAAAAEFLALHFLSEGQVVAFSDEATFAHTTVLQSYVVVVVDIVDAYHFVASQGEHICQFRAYKTCGSCHQYLHNA